MGIRGAVRCGVMPVRWEGRGRGCRAAGSSEVCDAVGGVGMMRRTHERALRRPYFICIRRLWDVRPFPSHLIRLTKNESARFLSRSSNRGARRQAEERNPLLRAPGFSLRPLSPSPPVPALFSYPRVLAFNSRHVLRSRKRRSTCVYIYRRS